MFRKYVLLNIFCVSYLFILTSGSNDLLVYKNITENNISFEAVIEAYEKVYNIEEYERVDRTYIDFIESRLSKHGISNYKPFSEDISSPFLENTSVIVTSDYGIRRLFGKWDMHYGVDLLPLYDTTVYAPISGEIITLDYSSMYGNYIQIKNSIYIITLAHLGSINKEYFIGSMINQNDVIGYVGMTGTTTGLHLHYSIQEIKDDGLYYSKNPYTNSTLRRLVDVSRHRNKF